jgi:uncharacterized membrane protein YfcA
MKFFLKLTHFDLFLLLILPISVGLLIGTYTQESLYNEVLNIIFFLFWIGWIYSIGNLLGRRWDKGKLALRLFHFCIFFYLFFITIATFKVYIGINSESILFSLIVIFALLSVFYCLYYVSKMLVILEKQREIKFKEHQIEFFLFFIFIIGIWILQPRINQLNDKLDL